jgi:phosphoribosylformylglycinamidine cyclo-ligase
MSDSRYEQRGVSASKSEVHAAIKGLDKGLFPTAFCKILPDLVAGDSEWCNIMHADTAGTKTSLAYMYWKTSGKAEVWPGIVQDAMVMNLDDMACVGCFDNIVLSSTIGRNKHLVDGGVLGELIAGTQAFIAKMKEFGIQITSAGGETADVGDIVRTLDVGFTTFARMRRDELVVNDIRPGDLILGIASSGQAVYESAYNSGIGSNGLTSARHDVLHNSHISQFPESFDPNTSPEVLYTGKYELTDVVALQGATYTVGDLLTSPTRTYLPVLKSLIPAFRSDIHGIPPVFELIQSASGADWREMYQVFNMGHRMELYLDPKADVAAMIELIGTFGIAAQVVGRVEEVAQNEVLLSTPYGSFSYLQ